ncbi:MAG: shikimate dehydrogenase family protein [Candidatus Dormibacteraceae bacterium]
MIAQKVVLLGQGIGYSASPAMQAAAFAAADLEWSYELLDVPPERLAVTLSQLREEPFVGANVTIPHKVAVMSRLDEIEGEAVAAGAVNTIRREGQRLIGSNTDVAGLRAALATVGLDDCRGRVVVLGGGGSARAAAVALAGADLTFVVRRPRAAKELPGEIVSWEDAGWKSMVRQADLLINTTPLGRQGELPVALADLPAGGAVIDLVYVAGGTPLIRCAAQARLKREDGWGILLAQGAAAFTTWTGLPAPLDVMRAALPC